MIRLHNKLRVKLFINHHRNTTKYSSLFLKFHATFQSRRSFTNFNHDNLPSVEFKKSFLNLTTYHVVNKLLFEKHFREEFLHDLRSKKEFTDRDLKQLNETIEKILDCLNEFVEAQDLVKTIWVIISEKPDNESTILLKERIEKINIRLKQILYRQGNYDLYRRIFYYKMKASAKTIDDLNIITSELRYMPNKSVTFNLYKIKQLLDPENHQLNIDEKRDFLINFTRIGLSLTKEDAESRYKIIEAFIALSKTIEESDIGIIKSRAWFVNSENPKYNEIFHLLGIPPYRTTLSSYAGNIITFVQHHHSLEESYIYITRIMEQLVEKIPKLTYTYFNFKKTDQTTKELQTMEVFNPVDLKLVMKSCFLLNDEHLALTYYLQNKKLRDYALLEAFFLELCITHKDWKSLQYKFEELSKHEKLPQSIHYSQAMKGLYYLKGYSDLNELFHQMLEQKIRPSFETYSILLLSSISQNDQHKVIELFNDYLELADKDIADVKSIPKLLELVFDLPLRSRKYDQVIFLVETYLKREQSLNYEIVSPETLSHLLISFSKNFAINEFKELKKIIKAYKKSNLDVLIGLIQSHTILGEYRLADKYAFKAHQESTIPFSDNRVYLYQMKNYSIWEENTCNSQSKKFCEVKLTYLSIMFNKARYLIFQQFEPQTNVELLVELQDYFYKNDNIDNIKLVGFIKDINLRKSLNTKANLINLKSDLLQSPELEFFSERSNKNFFPEFVVQNKDLFDKRKIPISAKTCYFILKNYLYLNKLRSSDLNFKKSKDLLDSLFQNYGISLNGFKEIAIDAKFDFFTDYIHIFNNLKLYVDYTNQGKNGQAAEEAMKYFSNFAVSVKNVYKENVPYDLKFEINKELRKFSQYSQKTYIQLLEDDCNYYKSLVKMYFDEQPRDKRPSIPSNLNKYAGIILEKFYYHLNYEKSIDDPTVTLIFDLIKKGMKLSKNDLNKLVGILLDNGSKYLGEILNIVEYDIIQNNIKYLELYHQKRQCYITCLIFLLNNSKHAYKKIYHKYQILNQFYSIDMDEIKKISEDAKKNVWESHKAGNFFRGKTGKLFTTKYEPYMFRTMNSYEFFNFFNPLKESRFLSTFLSFRNLLLLQVRLKSLFEIKENEILDSSPLDPSQSYFQNNENKSILKKLQAKYPRILLFLTQSWQIDYYNRMNDYIRQVDSFMALNDFDKDTIEYSSKKYLKSLIAPTNESQDFFITADTNINSSMEKNRYEHQKSKELREIEEKKPRYKIKKPKA